MDSYEIKKVFRKATQKYIDVWNAARDKEYETQYKGREILGKLGLKMKLSDVEYQGDGNKATFYYTADDRVDFRQLIRDFASTFGIRVEMKQVGLRQEAARLGGVGSCGRELCCSTWLTDLRKVNTTAARYQQLSLNPQKLAGQCGKLKCCLNYELDTYVDALKQFPKQETILKTEKGDAVFVKMDIFKELLWYTYKEDRVKWYKLTLEHVKEIITLNRNKELVASLEEFESEIVETAPAEFENVVGQDSLTRFDAPKTKKKKKNSRKKPQRGNPKQENSSADRQQNTPVAKNKEPFKKSNQGGETAIPEAKQGGNPRRKPKKKPFNKKPVEASDAQQPAAKQQVKKKPATKGNQQNNPANSADTNQSSPNQQKAAGPNQGNRNRNKKRRPPKKDNNPSNNA